MASRTAPKKTPHISEFPFEDREWQTPKRSKGGRGALLIWPELNGQTFLTFQGVRPDPRFTAECHTDEAAAARQKFIDENLPVTRTKHHLTDLDYDGNPIPPENTNRNVRLGNLSPELIKHIERLDNSNIDMLAKNSESWFGRKIPREQMALLYSSNAILKYPEPGSKYESYGPSIRVRLSTDWNLSSLMLQTPHDKKMFNACTYKQMPQHSPILPCFRDGGLWVNQMTCGGILVLGKAYIFEASTNFVREEMDLDGMGIVESMTFVPETKTAEAAEAADNGGMDMADDTNPNPYGDMSQQTVVGLAGGETDEDVATMGI